MNEEQTRSQLVDEMQDALGADIRIPMSPSTAEDLESIARRFSDRLVSSGGRPSDPEWTITRRVPFSSQTWQQLGYLANRLGGTGRSIAPAQLAASLIEDGVAELDRIIKSEETQARIRGES